MEFLENEILNITNVIINEAKSDDNGVYWESPRYEKKSNSVIYDNDLNIYKGDAGVLLFLLESYLLDKSQKTLTIFNKGIKRLIKTSHIQGFANNSFFLGEKGVIYLLTQAYLKLGEDTFLEEAIQLAKEDELLKKEYSKFEILYGLSGEILGLLMILSLREDSELENLLIIKVNLLLGSTKLHTNGIYWDEREYEAPLCGFSHGASGIGFVLVQLYSYFKNKIFLALAIQTFVYENNYFNKDENEWVDLRVDSYHLGFDETIKQELDKSNLGYFSKTKLMTAWCHGSPGIILSRLAYITKHNSKYVYNDIDCAKSRLKQNVKNRNVKKSSHSLCHGLGGNLLSLLESNRYKHDSDIEDLIFEKSKELINFYNQNGYYISGQSSLDNQVHQDLSLFSGISGLGYLYCKILNYDSNILCPNIYHKSSNSSDMIDQTLLLGNDFKEFFEDLKLQKNPIFQELVNTLHTSSDGVESSINLITNFINTNNSFGKLKNKLNLIQIEREIKKKMPSKLLIVAISNRNQILLELCKNLLSYNYYYTLFPATKIIDDKIFKISKDKLLIFDLEIISKLILNNVKSQDYIDGKMLMDKVQLDTGVEDSKELRSIISNQIQALLKSDLIMINKNLNE